MSLSPQSVLRVINLRHGGLIASPLSYESHCSQR